MSLKIIASRYPADEKVAVFANGQYIAAAALPDFPDFGAEILVEAGVHQRALVGIVSWVIHPQDGVQVQRLGTVQFGELLF